MNRALLAADAHWLPHGLDWREGRLLLLPTDAARLRAASFLDGRDDFSTGPGVVVPIEEALAWPEDEAQAEPDRFLFHVSFCGSTLLATLLDRPGAVLALKEPNILADLARWKTAQRQSGAAEPLYRPVLALALRLLRRPFAPAERLLVKPTNLSNNLILDLVALPHFRAAFIGMERRRFVWAVFRGNRERVAYTARVAAHLAAGDPDREGHVRGALEAGGEALDAMARLALLAHRFQVELFDRAMARAGLDPAEAKLDFADVAERPKEAAAKAAARLALPEPRIAPDLLKRDAKSRGRAFSAAEHGGYDEAIEAAHGARFDAALAWIDSRLG